MGSGTLLLALGLAPFAALRPPVAQAVPLSLLEAARPAPAIFDRTSNFPASIELSALDGSDGTRLNGAATGDEAGSAVSDAGDVNGDGFADLLIGASAADTNGSNSGAAYVVFGGAGGFAGSVALGSLNGTDGFVMNGAAAFDYTGRTVSGAGDVNGDGFDDLLVGASTADTNGNRSGAAYVVFGKPGVGSGGAVELSALNGNDGFVLNGVAAEDRTGSAVSGAGDVNGDGFADLLIGASYADPNGSNSGATYVVFGGASVGSSGAMELGALNGSGGFRLSGESSFDYTGKAVSGAGDVNGDGFDDLIVGSPYAGPNGPPYGAAYVVFGGVAVGSGGTIEVGALDGSNGFRLDGATISGKAGFSVGGAGDVNGDGFADILVGDPEVNSNGFSSGAAYVLFGGATVGNSGSVALGALDGSDGFRLKGAVANDEAGFSVSGAGDVNSDGFADLLVGAPYANSNGQKSGATYVVFGGAGVGSGGTMELSALDGSNGFRLKGAVTSDYAGFSVSGTGDVNGDGVDDLLVGARRADPNGINSGTAYLLFGRADTVAVDLGGLTGPDGFALEGAAAGDLAGRAVSGAGDVNGDGFDDLLVGAREMDSNGNNSGTSYVLFGSAAGFAGSVALGSLGGSAGFALTGAAANDQAGWAVSGAGDVNGDGFDDLLVGAPYADLGGNDAGAAYVVFGGASVGSGGTVALGTLDGGAGFRLTGAAAGDKAGWAVGGAGDVNGDGFDDLLVGAPRADAGALSSGAAYVLFGGTEVGSGGAVALGALDGSDGFRLSGESSYDYAGWAVSGAGDVDGDGFDDLLVGAPRASPTGSYTGLAYVVFGGEGSFPADLDLGTLGGSTGFVLTDAAPYDAAGQSVSEAGDVNGDGFDDLLVGAPREPLPCRAPVGAARANEAACSPAAPADVNGLYSPAAYVLFGGSGVGSGGSVALGSLDGTYGFIVHSATAYEHAGESVSGAGDVNGDGFDDLLLGAPWADPNGSYSGAGYVLFGGASVGGGGPLLLAMLDSSSGFVLNGTEAFAYAGYSASGAGDVNGDGFADLLIGAYGDDPNGSRSGAAYLVFGARLNHPILPGTGGDDTLRSTSASQQLLGALGADTLLGGFGDDLLDGGAGDDLLTAARATTCCAAAPATIRTGSPMIGATTACRRSTCAAPPTRATRSTSAR